MRTSFIRFGSAVVLVALWAVSARCEDTPNQSSNTGAKAAAIETQTTKAQAAAPTVVATKQLGSVDAGDVHRAIKAAVALQSAAASKVDENPLKQLAEAKVAAEKLADEKAADEKIVERKKAAAKAASDKAAGAEAAAMKAAAEKAAAEKAAVELGEAEKAAALKQSALLTALASVAQIEADAFGGLKPLAPEAWDYAKARHLLGRAGFGGTPEEIAKLHAMGLHQAVDFLVDYRERPALSLAFDAQLAERPSPEDRFRSQQGPSSVQAKRRQFEQVQIRKLREWWFHRMIQSQRPLQEKLTLFWHGHFATEFRTVRNTFALHQQNELFRQQAAGNFGSLLYGIIHDPAMLRYLDNNSNTKGKPNENLAREIMELFAMGEGQGYTEQDIMESARALTGYTFDQNSGQFRFTRGRHDTDKKSIFGRSGDFAGEDFVELILRQPATARFIAGKLFEFFTYENPDAETVDALASVLRKRDYELAPMLRNLFLSEEFYSSKSMATQIKSPVQLVVGTFRELGVKDVDCQPFEEAVRRMGQDLFDPPNVKGWEGGRFWMNANIMLTRYNVVADLVERAATPGKSQRGIDLVGALADKCFESPSEVVDYFAKCCFTVPLASDKREELIAFLSDLPPSSQWTDRRDQVNAKLRGLLVLMLTTPEYQMT